MSLAAIVTLAVSALLTCAASWLTRKVWKWGYMVGYGDGLAAQAEVRLGLGRAFPEHDHKETT